MSKMGYIFSRIAGMDYHNMFQAVSRIHDKTRKNRVGLFTDMVRCGFRYGAGYKDYELFEFYQMTPQQRGTYVTRTVNNSIVARLNDREYYHFFSDKVEFNKTFHDYVRRDWIDLRTASREQFCQFAQGKDAIIVKPLDATCGVGVEKFKTADYASAGELFDALKKREGSDLAEECIVQHANMAAIYPYAVNTIRVMTVLYQDEVHIVFACIRIGNNGKVVDNLNNGGMTSPVDVETGKIKFPAYDKTGKLYDSHPMTGHQLVGTQIPFWQESLDLCCRAAKVVPQVGFVGWDVAITPDGPLLIEANHIPGNDVYQLPPHTPGYIGMFPVYRKIIPDL